MPLLNSLINSHYLSFPFPCFIGYVSAPGTKKAGLDACFFCTQSLATDCGKLPFSIPPPSPPPKRGLSLCSEIQQVCSPSFFYWNYLTILIILPDTLLSFINHSSLISGSPLSFHRNFLLNFILSEDPFPHDMVNSSLK